MTFESPLTSFPGAAPRVAVVAPGGYAADEIACARGLITLQNLGCDVVCFYEPAEKFQRFGGTDAARLAQLDAALADPVVDIVLALRGGYGLSRLLASLDFDRIAESGKLLVGHSDFTVMQMALLARTGTPSFAGPMLCDDFTIEVPSAFMIDSFIRCLSGPVHRIDFACANNPEVDVTGMLWGGNLAILTHLAGTPYLPQVDGGILFVEDVNEHPYRVERMLLQLLHAGVLARQQAVILGDFSNYRLSGYDNGYDFDAMLAYLRATLPVPVLTGLPFGHMRNKVTLPVGAIATLSSGSGAVSMTMHGYPSLAATAR